MLVLSDGDKKGIATWTSVFGPLVSVCLYPLSLENASAFGLQEEDSWFPALKKVVGYGVFVKVSSY